MSNPAVYDVYKIRGSYYRINLNAPLSSKAEWYSTFTGSYHQDCTFDAAFIILHRTTQLVARNVVFKDRLCSQ